MQRSGAVGGASDRSKSGGVLFDRAFQRKRRADGDVGAEIFCQGRRPGCRSHSEKSTADMASRGADLRTNQRLNGLRTVGPPQVSTGADQLFEDNPAPAPSRGGAQLSAGSQAERRPPNPAPPTGPLSPHLGPPIPPLPVTAQPLRDSPPIVLSPPTRPGPPIQPSEVESPKYSPGIMAILLGSILAAIAIFIFMIALIVGPVDSGRRADPHTISYPEDSTAADDSWGSTDSIGGSDSFHGSEPQESGDETEDEGSSPPPRSRQTGSHKSEVLDWIEQVKQATVVVVTDRGQGSGFFIRSQGSPIVLTNFHVVESASSVIVKTRSNTMYRVRRGYFRPEYDLALLAVEQLNTPPAVLELRTGLPQLGEKVFAYGAPFKLEGTLTSGIVSSIRTTSELKELTGGFHLLRYGDDACWIQTDAAISPGNSGGPLLDAAGRVLGGNTWGQPEGENLNFAVSATTVRQILQQTHFEEIGPRYLGSGFARPPSAGDDPAEANLRLTLIKTAEFWSVLAAIMQEHARRIEILAELLQSPNPFLQLAALAQLRAELAAASTVISHLDRSHVAEQVAAAGNAVADHLDEFGAALDQLIADLQRGVANPLAARRFQMAMMQVEINSTALNFGLEQTRQALSQIYGVEFPQITVP